MNSETIRNLDRLLKSWRADRPNYEFCCDCVLGNEAWETLDPKIAFILKESNDDFHPKAGETYLPSGGNSHLFWRNLNMWKFITEKRGECSFEQTLAEKEKPATGFAYINLKKNAQSRRISDSNDIMTYVERDWSFLLREIDILKPDVLFCCGTFYFIEQKLKAIRFGERVSKLEDMLVVDFYHPSARRSYISNYELLSRILVTATTGRRTRGGGGP